MGEVGALRLPRGAKHCIFWLSSVPISSAARLAEARRQVRTASCPEMCFCTSSQEEEPLGIETGIVNTCFINITELTSRKGKI